MAVALAGTPTVKPQKLTISRKNATMTAKWSAPTAAWKSDKNNRRVQRCDIFIYFNSTKPKKQQKHIATWPTVDKKRKHYYKWGTISDKIDAHGMQLPTSWSQNYNRKSFYPFTKYRMTSVNFGVVFVNDRGVPPQKYISWVTYTFKAPRAPAISSPSISNNTTTMTCTITTNAGADAYERYDTQYWWERRDSGNRYVSKTTKVYNKKTKKYETKTTQVLNDYARGKHVQWGSRKNTTSTKFNTSGHMNELARLPYKEWVWLKVKAFARGINGNSSTVEKGHMFAQPAVPQIASISIDTQSFADTSKKNKDGSYVYVKAGASSGVVRISARSNSVTAHPVDTFYLQRCKNTEYTTATDVGYYGDWNDVEGASGGATCYGFSDNVSDAKPEPGKRTWYRVVTTHDNYVNYSEPVQATALYTKLPDKTVTTDKVNILSVTSMEDGTSLKVVLGVKNDSSESTEVSWSSEANAWESTDTPQTFSVDWYDSKSQNSKYPKTSTLYIKGLEEGVPYYIRARRYDQDESIYGPYANAPAGQYPIAPVTTPTDVKLTAPEYTERNKDIQLSWTYGGVSNQKKWILEGMLPTGAKWLTLLSGEDSLGSRKLAYATITGTLSDSSPEKIKLRVAVSTGSNFAYSPEITVAFADPPTIKASIDSVLTEQPAVIYLVSETGNVDVVAKVTAAIGGITDQNPIGEVQQLEGDGIWSDRFSPSWDNQTDEGFHARFNLPEGLEFIDTCRYLLEVTAVDRTSGLTSNPIEQIFTVSWSHQAQPPSTASRVITMPDSKSVQIYPVSPDNYENGDLCDIYRMTPDGGDLVASNVEFGGSAIDRFAPFSKNIVTYYRLCTRTRDGDEAWLDIPYSIRGHQIRVDWGDNLYVEYPYNVAFSDTYSKDSEVRSHMDGENAAYFNENVSHTASISSDLIRLSDPEQIRLTKELANYSGTSFVRLPDGSAYEAVVNVSNMSNSYDSLVLPITLDATAVTLTDRFRISSEDIETSSTGGSLIATTFSSMMLYWGKDRPLNNDSYEITETPVTSVTVKYATSADDYKTTYVLAATLSQVPPTTYEEYDFQKDITWSSRNWELVESGGTWTEYSEDGVPVAEYSTVEEIAEAYAPGFISDHVITDGNGNPMMVTLAEWLGDYSVRFYAGSSPAQNQPELSYVDVLPSMYSMAKDGSVYVQLVHGDAYVPIEVGTQEYRVLSLKRDVLLYYTFTVDEEVMEDIVYYEYDGEAEQYVAVTPQEGDSPLQNGWFVQDQEIDSDNPMEIGAYEIGYAYTLTEDTEVDPSKEYYARVDDGVYELVESPAEGTNPYESGYFERAQIYQRTADEVVEAGKTYYRYGDDPSALGWYEETVDGYSVTSDTEVDSDKTYYKDKYYAIDPLDTEDPVERGYFEKVEGAYVPSEDRVVLPGKLYYQKGSLLESGISQIRIGMSDSTYTSVFGASTAKVRFIYAVEGEAKNVIQISGVPNLDVPAGTNHRVTASYRIASGG